jgi:hypothetical protein
VALDSSEVVLLGRAPAKCATPAVDCTCDEPDGCGAKPTDILALRGAEPTGIETLREAKPTGIEGAEPTGIEVGRNPQRHLVRLNSRAYWASEVSESPSR